MVVMEEVVDMEEVDMVVVIRNHKLSKVFFQIINLHYTGIIITNTVKADMEYSIAYVMEKNRVLMRKIHCFRIKFVCDQLSMIFIFVAMKKNPVKNTFLQFTNQCHYSKL